MYPLPQKVNIPAKAHFKYVPETNIQIVVKELSVRREFYQITERLTFEEAAAIEDAFLGKMEPREYISPITLLESMTKRRIERAEARSKRIEAKLTNRATKKAAQIFRFKNK
jgi:hypothetical protein